MLQRFQLPTGFFRAKLDPDADAVFLPGSQPRIGTFQCVGGRHLYHVGGKQVWDWDGGAAERYRDVAGSIFIEGRHIIMKRSGDAISAGGTFREDRYFKLFPDVYIQNCRIENVHGSYDAVHADVFQLDYALRSLKVDRLTADTNYQAFYLRPVAPILSDVDLRRCNIKLNLSKDSIEKATLIYLFRNNDDVANSNHTVYLTDVYCEIPSQLNPLQYFSPRTGLHLGADGEGQYVWWPSLTQRIKDLHGRPGRIRIGPPPGGDFVPAASIGLKYRSPGYQCMAG